MEELIQPTILSDPLDRYPAFDPASLKALKNGTFRGNYGLELYQQTGQTSCAYCGLNFVDTHNHWLYMSIDHVVPKNIAKSLKIPRDYYDSIVNWSSAAEGVMISTIKEILFRNLLASHNQNGPLKTSSPSEGLHFSNDSSKLPKGDNKHCKSISRSG